MIQPTPPSRISIVGMGKLGVPIAACYARAGHQVIGVDSMKHVVDLLERGQAPVSEPGLDELLRECEGRLAATSDLRQAVHQTDATFIIVPTPSDGDGGFSLKHILSVCDEIGTALRSKSSYHLVGVISTVLPGATGGEILPRLEAASGKRCGVDFGICYCPEFVALGSVVRDLQNPDFILIGEFDSRSGETASKIAQTICANSPQVVRMNLVNAELTKLAVNTFVTTKITFANMLARLCERLPDAHVDAVTGALGMDRRIGKPYLTGAIGFGGPCFPRDNVALSFVGNRLGVNVSLAETVHAVNRQQLGSLLSLVKKHQRPNGTTGVLGLAYKPNTSVVEESTGIALAQVLAAEGMRVLAYDPLARENAAAVLGDGVEFTSSAAECCRNSDVVVVVTPCDEFKGLSLDDFDSHQKSTMIDCWRILDPGRFGDSVAYVALGVGVYHESGVPESTRD